MRNFIKQLGFSLLSGIVFSLSILIVMGSADLFSKEKGKIHYLDIDKPKDIIVSDDWINDKTTNLTIHGIVTNNGSKTYAYVYLKASIFADKAKIGECKTTMYRIKPAKSQAGLVECDNIESSGLPKNINYKIEIDQATQYLD